MSESNEIVARFKEWQSRVRPLVAEGAALLGDMYAERARLDFEIESVRAELARIRAASAPLDEAATEPTP